MRNIKRIAGILPGWAGLPAVLFFFLYLSLTNSVRAEDGNEVSPALRAQLGIRGALEIEFSAEQGSAYTVEAQTVDSDWVVIYGPVYGEDRTVLDFVPLTTRYIAYRLQVEDIAEMGHAPAELSGHTYSLNAGVPVGYFFATEQEGIETDREGHQRGFTYTYLKTTPDKAEVSINYVDGGITEVALLFREGRVGTFESTISREGRRDRRESGTFRAGNDVDPENAEPPVSLVDTHFVFRDRGMTMELAFETETTGSLSRQGGDAEVYSYTYDVTPWHEAILVVFPGAGERHEYTMTFGARNSGMFVRHVIADGQLRDTDKGKFSGRKKDKEDGSGGGDTEPECLAPEKVEGRTLKTVINGSEVTIILDGANTGSVVIRLANGRVSFKPFSYTYSKESGSEGNLTITFPTGGGEDVEVFELDFQTPGSGSCIRKRYESEELDDTDRGTFSLSAEPERAPNDD